jgi:FtsP/CotA-like multicopper oxidase with cupredoxin domain
MTHRRRAWTPAHESPPRLSRRKVLIGLGGLAAGGALAGTALRFAPQAAAATGTLTIPTLLEPSDEDGVSVYTLNMQTGTTVLRTGITSNTAGFNRSYLGPCLKVTNGERVRMEVTNNIGAETTVHWHGAHIPPSVDGGPQNIIAAGDTWSPEFDINQEACTLWFTDYADDVYGYMLHCHNAIHEDEGMMLMLMVSDS